MFHLQDLESHGQGQGYNQLTAVLCTVLKTVGQTYYLFFFNRKLKYNKKVCSAQNKGSNTRVKVTEIKFQILYL